MDTEKIRKLTPYQDINSLLADWTEKAKNILGENVVGLYLSGSLSYGDFVPERSDIDLQAVIRRPLNESELKSIEQLHRGLDERYPAWKGRLECSYVPQWENLIEEAEQWEYGKEMKRHDEAVAFIRFAIEKVNETGILGSRAHDAKSVFRERG